MKLRWKITVGLAVVGVFVAAFLLLRSDNSEQKAVEETRRALRQQGFKTDLTEFNFSTSAELRRRAAPLTGAYQAMQSSRFQDNLNLMTPVGSNSALVVWKEDILKTYSGEALWPALHDTLNEDRAALDAACEAARSGPIRFDLKASAGNGMVLPHLSVLKRLTQTFSARAMLQLHNGNNDAAWTNLVASTRLATSYDAEPAEISHLVRYACAAIAFNATWQALQASSWADDQLGNLQRDWESVDFFKGLPETAAFTRASMAAMCQLERRQPMSSGITLRGLLQAPRSAWSGLTEYRRQLRYRHHGTYEDEKDLLLFYRDRELQLRRAVQSPTWSEMCLLPGATNMVPFKSKYYSRMQAMINLRQSSLGFQLQGQGLLGRAADAEARRRLVITAIALERYRGRHGSYPRAIQELVPELLAKPPIDFMDGQPLRYRVTDEGHFVLYSVGLDCIDNGGEMRWRGRRAGRYETPDGFGIPQALDLVWPLPASAAAVRAQEEEKRQAILKRIAEAEQEMALRRERTMAALEDLYAKQQPRRSKEPTYQGQPLSKVLRNAKATGTTQLTLDELLTVKQIITGQEPDIATFEVPASYDAVTNVEGNLRLLVDADPEESPSSDEAELPECERATNGNCLLVWNTTYDPPGKHYLQAQLLYVPKEDQDEVKLKGPLVSFLSSNLCQFDASYSGFDSRGATFYAKLPESNGTYTIELKSPAGVHVRTFRGSTSNGVIDVHWDLTDEHGKTYTNDSVENIFHVTLPDSGRSQTMKGP